MIATTTFDEIIENYSKLIFSVCYSLTGNYFSAEDLTQETFISAYQHYKNFDGNHPKAWLVQIASNKCKDFLKKSSTQKELPSEPELSAISTEQQNLPLERILDEEVKYRFQRLLKKTKEPYTSTLEQYFLKQNTLQEIALQQNLPLKTIHTRFYRGKKILKELWKEEFNSDR